MARFFATYDIRRCELGVGWREVLAKRWTTVYLTIVGEDVVAAAEGWKTYVVLVWLFAL